MDGDVVTVVQRSTVAGLGDRMLAPKQGVVFTRSGRFESILTIQLDISVDPPSLISFDEEILTTSGSIRDSFSADELAKFCEALGGSISP